MLTMQSSDPAAPASNLGHRHTQSFAAKSTEKPFSLQSSQPSTGTLSDRIGHRANISINTGRTMTQPANYNGTDMQTPGTGIDLNYSLLPAQLLMGSPFQTTQFQTFSPLNGNPQNSSGRQPSIVSNGFSQQSTAFSPQQATAFSPTAFSPTGYAALTSPTALGASPYFNGLQSPTTGFNALAGGAMGGYGQPLNGSGNSRTVYLGNIPTDTSAEEILNHVRSGQIESVRLLPDKNCAFLSFTDSSAAFHFHSDAILKKMTISGQEIKIGYGRATAVPTSVALAVQQHGASRNVYLGNLPEDITEQEIREVLSKFGPLDTVKLLKDKAIAFVHFLSIGNAIKAVTQLPTDPKWSARRVFYGKDRTSYVSRTQQENAAQYLGIAPGYAHVLNGADRDLITNALAQQSIAAAAVATTTGGANNLGNRTIYLGNIHPETTVEEICNVVRGGLLQHIRYIAEKHICFLTFVDPASAASFYALSNLQGLLIHSRRLKLGWGKNSGPLPAAIALAVSGGATRNVYVGNLDDSWTVERLRRDFEAYGEVEQVNTLPAKSCAFVNFTNIANAIKAIEAMRGKEEYRQLKISHGKDRVSNPPRQTNGAHQQHSQNRQPNFREPFQPQQQAGAQESNLHSDSPVQGLQALRLRGSVSPASGISNGSLPTVSGPTASTIVNAGPNNPLTMYLMAAQQSAQAQAQTELAHSQFLDTAAPTAQAGSASNASSVQSAFYSSPNEVTGTRASGLEPPGQQQYGHGSHQSVQLTNGTTPNGLYPNQSLQAAQRSHNRAVSLPAFNLQQAQQLGMANGLAGLGTGLAGSYGLGVGAESTLPGWAEEEVA